MAETLRSPDADPALFARLVEQHRRFLERWNPRVGLRQADALERQTRQGSMSAFLWRSPANDAVGLARLQTLPSGLRVHGVWVEPPGLETLAVLLSDLEQGRGRPIATVTDILPGVSEVAQDRFFGVRGFWHRAKVRMQRPEGLPPLTAPTHSEIRPIEVADLPRLVGVYARAYSERPGEFWTWAIENAWAEAELDVLSHSTPSGAWAEEFSPELSFVWDSGGKVLGGVLVSQDRPGIPYVEDLIVEPSVHRHGIGRALMERTIAEVEKERSRAIELAAIRFGAPYRLYLRLGFEELGPPEGSLDGHWVRGRDPTRSGIEAIGDPASRSPLPRPPKEPLRSEDASAPPRS